MSPVSLLEVDKLGICHNFSRDLKYVQEHAEGYIWDQCVLFLLPDECQYFLQNTLQLHFYKNTKIEVLYMWNYWSKKRISKSWLLKKAAQ